MNPRRACFILSATDHGPMIVNRLDMLVDYKTKRGVGVGCQLLERSQYERDEILSVLALLDLRRASHGDGMVALDIGANIGVHTIEMAKHMTGWGGVIAFEPQERIYYALAGNIAINNCFNAQVVFAAVGRECGMAQVPVLDHQQYASFGGVTLRTDLADSKEDGANHVGQISEKTEPVNLLSLDSMDLERVDLIKIDVEGMELDVLDGAIDLIKQHKPIIFAEWIRCGKKALTEKLESFGYRIVTCDSMNLVGVHPEVGVFPQAA